MTTNSFKHSGTLGDIIYGLAVMKHLGGGEFYLHLGQTDWIGQYYYGAPPQGFHQGRMNEQDLAGLRELLLCQDYITKCEALDPSNTEITHNLDRFRKPFVGHPGNYVDIYADVFGITDPTQKEQLRNTPWLTVPSASKIQGRGIVINRTPRWRPAIPSNIWAEWKEAGFDQEAVFIGLPTEYQEFCRDIGWEIPHIPTNTLLDAAMLIAGADCFIGNQSVALSIAIALGHTNIWCEARKDLDLRRNECYFPNRPGLKYF